MVDPVYRQALSHARKQLYELTKQSQKIAREAAKLRQTITTLERMCGETPTSSMKLSEAVLSVLTATDKALSVGGIKRALEQIGYDLSKYSNPLAVIHTTVKRAVKKGDVSEGKPNEYGQMTYVCNDIPF
ncbi:MAG TPA: hypothetical protein VES67_24260 [Vicinamibacterales bacterium]|nr:hypothetical protein [Vicinamibacterales bacterium]